MHLRRSDVLVFDHSWCLTEDSVCIKCYRPSRRGDVRRFAACKRHDRKIAPFTLARKHLPCYELSSLDKWRRAELAIRFLGGHEVRTLRKQPRLQSDILE